MEPFLRNQILNICRVRNNIRIRDVNLRAAPTQARFERIKVDGDVLSYSPKGLNIAGVYIAATELSLRDNYFEIEVLDSGGSGCIAIGLVPYGYDTQCLPGWNDASVAYHSDDGKLYKSSTLGSIFGPVFHTGHLIGCGIKYKHGESSSQMPATVFFTKNGKEIGTIQMQVPHGGFHPAVSLHASRAEVRLNLAAEWRCDELAQMAVDSEDEWNRLHDIRLNGSLLEYAGLGKTIHDVGLAQASIALDTTCHYFELEIVDPGENCYIAIGLARKNYPKQRHPGWNRGSIAYHADDGKIFVGSGVGEKFGPKCYTGDIMGCGIVFPPQYDSEADNESPSDDPEPIYSSWASSDDEDYDADFDDDDEDDHLAKQKETGTKVQIFFTRNGKTLGRRPICIPRGGLYPTIGMLSTYEKVRVDLRPLTG